MTQPEKHYDADGTDDDGGEDGDYQWLQAQLADAGGLGMLGEDADDGEEGPGQGWTDPSGGTLTEILEACELGQVDRLRQALEHLSIDVNTPGPDGDSALHVACLYDKHPCVLVLLSKGADANAVNEQDGSTPLHDAAASGSLKICELLTVKCHPDTIHAADEDGDTPLHNAARGNHLDIVKLLLAKGADPRAVNSAGNTPGAEADEEEVLEVLREAERAAAEKAAALKAANGEGGGSNSSRPSRAASAAAPLGSPPR